MTDSGVVAGGEVLVVGTPDARVWSGTIFGLLLVASAMAVTDPDLPGVWLDPLGLAICVVLSVLLVRVVRMAVVVDDQGLVIRGYLTSRRLSKSSVFSISLVDYPGPWWLNTERVRALRFDLESGKHVTAWGVTGSERRLKGAKARLVSRLRDSETGRQPL